MRLDPASLPADVRDMVDAILAATHSGNIADLAGPIEWNEMRPVFDDEPGAGATADLIDRLRKVSRDGRRRDLALLHAAPVIRECEGGTSIRPAIPFIQRTFFCPNLAASAWCSYGRTRPTDRARARRWVEWRGSRLLERYRDFP